MKSLRAKFFSFLTVLIVSLLLLLNFFPVTSSRDTVFQEKESSISGQATILSSSLSQLDSPSQESVAEVIRLLDITGFDKTVVVDSAGQIVYSSGTSAISDSQADDLATALSGQQLFRSSYDGDAFTSSCSTPISRKGVVTGALYLLERDTDRAQILQDMQQQIRMISIVTIMVVLVLALVFSTVIIRRIYDLETSMQIVAAGDYSHRVQTHGNDEISQLGKEFNTLTERLDNNERQRRRFVSDASHELKTPLASIRLLSDSIVQNENIDTETVREFVTDIGNEAERLQRTTEKLLDLSRLDDDIQVLPEPVDMNQVTMDAVALLKPLADEKLVSIESDLEEGCVVMATVDDMFHIIFNLIENAIKYNVPEGKVSLTLKADDGSVKLTVADTGIGIPEAERYNIFTRFYRVDKARSREAGGSGLGLSIVHDGVKAHGGTIQVGENKPQGSIFTVIFPRPTAEETGI
jgi:signal transduction histidine kinase